MKVLIRYFASIQDLIGLPIEEIEIEKGFTLNAMLNLIKKIHKSLQKADKILISINGEYADLETLLKEGDEIALFPPVSGG